MATAYWTSLLYLTIGIILILIGIIICKENFKQRINRITGIMMFFAATGTIFAAFGLLLQNSSIEHTNLEILRKLFLIWEFFFPQMLLFSLVFPFEFKWFKKHRLLTWSIFIPHIIHFFIVITFSSTEQIRNLINLQYLSDNFGLFFKPIEILLGLIFSLLSLVYRFHVNFFSLINLIYIITAITLMSYGYRRLKNKRLKRQVSIVLWGIRTSVGLYTIAFIFPHLHILKTSQTMAHLLTSVALLIGAGSIAWAIIKYQFLDIRLIIRRGLIFSLAFSFLIGLYFLLYTQGKRLFSSVFLIDVPLIEIIFFIIALLIFQPILSLIENFIEYIFLRDKMDYRNVLNDLSKDILTTLDITALKIKITTTLKNTLSLENVRLMVTDQEGILSCENNNKTIFFSSEEKWIEELMKEKGYLGYEELVVRTGNNNLEELQKLDPFLLIPLIHRNQLKGVLILGEKIIHTNFNTEDMTILSLLSSQTAIAIENAQLYKNTIEKQQIEKELAVAGEIQRNLLPNIPPAGESFEFHGYNLPSKAVGGDFYDFLTLNDHKIGIAIGDISGKGIPAAILMSNLQAAFRISAKSTKNTREAISQINNHISETTSSEKFATFFYGVLNIKNMSFEYTNAGHNYPILWRNNGTYILLKEGGIVLGIINSYKYQSKRITLRSGDTLIFYTDGITEAMNPYNEEFGNSRLMQVIKRNLNQSAENLLNIILQDVDDFTHGHLQADDLTLVTMKVK